MDSSERNLSCSHCICLSVLLFGSVGVIDLTKGFHLAVIVLVRDRHDGQVDTSFLSSVLLEVIKLFRSERDSLLDSRGFCVSRIHVAVISHGMKKLKSVCERFVRSTFVHYAEVSFCIQPHQSKLVPVGLHDVCQLVVRSLHICDGVVRGQATWFKTIAAEVCWHSHVDTEVGVCFLDELLQCH